MASSSPESPSPESSSPESPSPGSPSPSKAARREPLTVTSGSSATAAVRRAVELIDVLSGNQRVPDADTSRAVAAVLAEHGEPDIEPLTAADVAGLRTAAVRLRQILTSPSLDRAAAALNELLRQHAGPPRLTAHGGTAWHLHFDADDDGPWADWLICSSAWAFAVLFAERQQLPAGICAAPDCDRPYVDLGQGPSRRFCSTRCATRVRVAAHRTARR